MKLNIELAKQPPVSASQCNFLCNRLSDSRQQRLTQNQSHWWNRSTKGLQPQVRLTAEAPWHILAWHNAAGQNVTAVSSLRPLTRPQLPRECDEVATVLVHRVGSGAQKRKTAVGSTSTK